jgi:SAM-dependent methyltransferase
MGSPPAPPLPPEIERRFLRWVEEAAGREPLTFPEIRRGVRALSARYVEGRGEHGAVAGALAGAGLRAAFASYYAPLHFLTAFAAAQALPAPWRAGVRRVIDLGAGTGAVGAALALATGGAPVLALDRAAWALAEARRSFAALGVAGRTRRAELPAGVPHLRADDLVCAGFVLNECRPELRERLLRLLARALGAGTRVLVLEPLARGAAPWWDEAAAALARAGAESALLKYSIERPDWIARLDDAAGLDHREIGARVLWGPANGGMASEARSEAKPSEEPGPEAEPSGGAGLA